MLEVMQAKRPFNPLAVLGLFVVVLIMSTVLLAVMFLNRPASEVSFDTRRAAMVESGLAELNTYPFHQSTLKVKETQTIDLQLNTKDKSLSSIELIFEVIADVGLLDKSKIAFTGTLPTTLEVNKMEIIESLCEKDCYTITLLLSVKDEEQPFTSNDQMKTISQLSFTPQKEGSLKLKISQDSTALESVSGDDILQKPTVLDFQYYITDNGIDRAQCEFTYTNWGECRGGWQTRQYSVQPDRCYWYEEETLAELSRTCSDPKIIKADSDYFRLSSNDRCLNQPSDGSSLFVVYNKDKYPNVDWVDVSSSPEFNDFYHKKVDGNIARTDGNWLTISATGFTHATGNKGPLSFQPNQEYFFRLHTTDGGGKHIASVRYYITYCSGDQSSYKNCNDACGADSDQSKQCAPGLSCYEGQCRNTKNPDNNLCLATPGIATNDRSCNEYCANNNDCAAGLRCHWNRCRNPQNLESSSCAVASTNTASTGSTRTTNSAGVIAKGTSIRSYTNASGTTVLLPSEAYDLTTYACNQGCNNNRDCDADLRCYNGKCRLAANPENASCAVTSSNNANTQASAAASITNTPTNNPTPTSVPAVSDNASWLQQQLDHLMANFAWQWLAAAGAVLLVAMLLIITAILRAKKDPWAMPKASRTSNTHSSATLPPKHDDGEVAIPEDKPLQL